MKSDKLLDKALLEAKPKVMENINAIIETVEGIFSAEMKRDGMSESDIREEWVKELPKIRQELYAELTSRVRARVEERAERGESPEIPCSHTPGSGMGK